MELNKKEEVVLDGKDATSEIKDDYFHYGEDVLLTKLPNFVDGCKALIRRILWFTRDEKKELAPLGQLVGNIQRYHPSGDKSISEAMIRLGQPFVVGHPLITISGKYGEYYDPDAHAHTRYLEGMSSEFTQDIYFNGVNLATIPMVPTKDFREKEPTHLIPRLPMALILGNLTVGFGFKSDIPPYDFTQICKLVQFFSKYYQDPSTKLDRPIDPEVAKFLIPAFPIRNLIRNRRELLANYAKGIYDAPIRIEGWAELSGNQVTLRTLPYGTNFGDVSNNFRELFSNIKKPKENEKIKKWVKENVDSANNYNGDDNEFTIVFKHGTNPFEIFEKIKGLLHFDYTWHPHFNYVKDGRVVTLDPPSLIKCWYYERKINIAGGLKYRQAMLIERELFLKALLIIADHMNDVIKIIRSSDNADAAITALYTKYTKLTLKQVKIIVNQPLGVLSKMNRKDTEKKLEDVKTELSILNDNFTKIDQTIANDAAYLQSKYKSTSQTVYSEDFIGYVQFGDLGIIHFFDYDEMRQILQTKGWPTAVVKSIHLYKRSLPRRYFVRGGKTYPLTEVSKELWCEQVICYPSLSSEALTLVITPDKQHSCIIKRIVDVAPEGYTFCHVTPEFFTVARTGEITYCTQDDFSIRKTISQGARSNVIYGFPNTHKDITLFYMSTADLNTLYMARITLPEKITSKVIDHLRFMTTGNIEILDLVPSNTEDLFLNVPRSCTKSLKLSYIEIKNLMYLYETKPKQSRFSINFNRSRSELGVKFHQDNMVNSLYVLDFTPLKKG